MTYTTEVQTIEAFGVSYAEQRYQPEVEERQLITIEFEPPSHPLNNYGYSQPQFTFLETVAIREQLDDCFEKGLNLSEELDFYQVGAIELNASYTAAGRLQEAPTWQYGVRCHSGTQEMVWFEEEELISKWDIVAPFDEF